MRDQSRRRLHRRDLLRLVALGGAALPLARTLPALADHLDPADVPPVWIPPGVRAGERWVAVNLSAQAAIGMVGAHPVRVALATTGKPGWWTPEGEFRILWRVYNETMTSRALGIDPRVEFYELHDVLFTQYFTSVGHALHLNYWRPQSVFGNEATSHGCVGLRYADAEFFWNHLGNGSRVVVHS